MFDDTKFTTADEKAKIVKTWRRFVASGYKRTIFTKALYRHLSVHCGFIAHYNIDGFYAERFADPQGRAATLQQIFNGGLGYRGDSNYRDINLALAECIDIDAGMDDAKEQARIELVDHMARIARKLRDEYGMLIEIHAETT